MTMPLVHYLQQQNNNQDNNNNTVCAILGYRAVHEILNKDNTSEVSAGQIRVLDATKAPHLRYTKGPYDTIITWKHFLRHLHPPTL